MVTQKKAPLKIKSAAAPKKKVAAAPKKKVAAAPKKKVATAPKKKVAAAPKKKVAAAPKKKVAAAPKKKVAAAPKKKLAGPTGILAVPYRAPSLTGKILAGETLKASRHAGKWVVLYFYPKDMTSGCTLESRDFQSLSAAFAKAGAALYGASKDSCESHSKFAEKEGLKGFLLISDEGNLCSDFGVWQEKSNYGKTYMGIVRSTFLIDPAGMVRARWTKVRVADHAQAVLDTLLSLRGAL
jgi:thioredoxin-dependent peroxiredoxin